MSVIAIPDKFPKYVKRNNHVFQNQEEMKGIIQSVSVNGRYAMISTIEDDINKVHTYDLEQRKGVSTFTTEKRLFGFHILNSNQYLSANLMPYFKERKAIYSIVNCKDGTLSSQFYNTLQLLEEEVEIKTHTEYNQVYSHNGELYVKQALSDTVYKMKTSTKMVATYVLNTGSKKLTIKEAATGEVNNKMIPLRYQEAEKFIYFSFSIGRDFPNNRKDGGVQFRYYYYDKKNKKLYKIKSNVYPEDFIFSLPLTITQLVAFQ